MAALGLSGWEVSAKIVVKLLARSIVSEHLMGNRISRLTACYMNFPIGLLDTCIAVWGRAATQRRSYSISQLQERWAITYTVVWVSKKNHSVQLMLTGKCSKEFLNTDFKLFIFIFIMSYTYIVKCDHVLQPCDSFRSLLWSFLNISTTTAASTVSLFGTWS